MVTIIEKDDVEKSVQKFKEYILKEHDKIGLLEIVNRYKEYTPEYVYQQFLNVIKAV